MRCIACDSLLNQQENNRKNSKTGEYEQMCNPCFGSIAADLIGSIDPEDEIWDDPNDDSDEDDEDDDEDSITEPPKED